KQQENTPKQTSEHTVKFTPYNENHFKNIYWAEQQMKELAKEYRPVVKLEENIEGISEEIKLNVEWELTSFCSNMAKEMHRRLQPNVEKGETTAKAPTIPMGGANFLVLDNYFGRQPGVKRDQSVKCTKVNGIKIPERVYTYTFANNIPALQQQEVEEWYVLLRGCEINLVRI
ncbi:pyrH, partial [Acrasis kona]